MNDIKYRTAKTIIEIRSQKHHNDSFPAPISRLYTTFWKKLVTTTRANVFMFQPRNIFGILSSKIKIFKETLERYVIRAKEEVASISNFKEERHV